MEELDRLDRELGGDSLREGIAEKAEVNRGTILPGQSRTSLPEVLFERLQETGSRDDIRPEVLGISMNDSGDIAIPATVRTSGEEVDRELRILPGSP